MDKTNLIIILLFLLVIGIFLNTISYSFFQVLDYYTIETETENSESINNITITSEDEIINLCFNLSLSDTASCLVKNTQSFYIYNITNDNINLSFIDLQLRGGDCRDWSLYYQNLAKKLGFRTSSPVIVLNEATAHRYAVINDYSGYCIIDQRNYHCILLN